MHEISIVKRRSRFLPVLLVVLLLAILALAAFWFLGDRALADFDFNSATFEVGRRTILL